LLVRAGSAQVVMRELTLPSSRHNFTGKFT